MAETSLWLLILVIVVAVVFDFANGFNDAANAIATVVSTRVLTPGLAILLAATMNMVGAFSGTAVAKVVGSKIVDPDSVNLITIVAGVGGAAIWVLTASRFGLPVSGSHSLLSGVAGAGIATAGWSVLIGSGVRKVLIGIFVSPLIAFVLAYIFMMIIYRVFSRSSSSTTNAIFAKLQILSAAAMGFSHGSNDAQKTMGIIALALFVSGRIDEFTIPIWVIFLSGTVMALGTYMGGWRVIHTLGSRIVRMRPANGFAAESTAAAIIEAASKFGVPLSTTQAITACILGQGATIRLSAVRWGVAESIVMAWIVTLPVCGLLGAGLYVFLGRLLL